MMKLRVKRLAIATEYHLTVIGLGVVAVFLGSNLGASTLVDAGIILLLFHLITFRRIPMDRFLAERVLRSFRCQQCRLVIGLTQPLKCGCGFISERHVFSPCPACINKAFAFFSCPRCGTGILI